MKARALLFSLIMGIAFITLTGLPTAQAQTQAPFSLTPTTIPVALPATQPGPSIVNPINNKLYLPGQNGVTVVVDVATGTILDRIQGTNGAADGLFVNTTNNQIIMVNNSIQIIDSQHDTILQTLQPQSVINTLPSSLAYTRAGYNPALNRVYTVETLHSTVSSTAPSIRLIAVDLTTGAESIIDANNDELMPGFAFPNYNAATNKIYMAGFSGKIAIYAVYDAGSNTKIGGTACPPDACTGVIRGVVNGTLFNPADNSFWFMSKVQFSEIAADGHTVLFTPAETDFNRVDPITNQLTTFTEFAFFTAMGFDRASGRMIGYGNCMPTVSTDPPALQADACSLTNTTGLPIVLQAFDPANPSRLIDLGPATTNSPVCTSPASNPGNGPFGMDPSGGFVYATDCSNPVVVFVSKGTFTGTPTASFPPTLDAGIHPVALATGSVTTQLSNLIVPATGHIAFMVASAEDLLITVDPIGLTTTSEPLGGSSSIPALPAELALNSVTNKLYVSDSSSKTVNVIDTTTNTVVSQILGAGGPFIAVNPNTNQFVVASPSDSTLDPNQVNGATLFDGVTQKRIQALPAAANVAIAVNPVTNIGYFVDATQYYVVDLATGTRLFTGGNLAGSPCTLTGIAVNSVTNQYYIGETCVLDNGSENNIIFLVDGSSNVAIGSGQISDGSTIGRLALNPVSNKLYVEISNPATPPSPGVAGTPAMMTISILDASSLTLLNKTGLAFFPVAFNTVKNVVYSRFNSAYVVYDGVNDQEIAVITNQSNPMSNGVQDMTVDQNTGNLYVSNVENNNPNFPGTQVGSQVGVVNVYKQAPLFHVGGRVFNGNTPLVNFAVSMDSDFHVAFTDSNGNFTFLTRIFPGTYHVEPVFPVTTACGGLACVPAVQTVTVTDSDITNLIITGTPIFRILGKVQTASGVGIPNVTVSVQGTTASAISGPDGSFTLNNLTGGVTYTLNAQSASFAFAPQTVSGTVYDVNVVINPTTPITFTQFNAAPPTGFIAAGIALTGTFTLSQTAPFTGLTITLTSSNAKVAKVPASISLVPGQSIASFAVQISGVSTGTPVTITASYSGSLSPTLVSASSSFTVEPTDTIHGSGTWSKSTGAIVITATDNVSVATIDVYLASGGGHLGTMTSDGKGNYTFTTTFPGSNPPSINLKSNLNGSTGLGLKSVQ